MDNFKNTREDKELFPYEFGAKNYNDMREVSAKHLQDMPVYDTGYVDANLSGSLLIFM